MIDLHYWPTPNGWKVTIFLEEAELPYKVIPVNIGAGEQFKPEFLAISPNNRMPAIVDHEPADGGAPISVFESGAILQYLAEKTGKFLPKDVRGRNEVFQWVYWQMGGLGPMTGQANHFKIYASEKIPYAIDRYMKEVNRLHGVMERRLKDRLYLAGNDYTIADMMSYPWVRAVERLGLTLTEFPHLEQWFVRVGERPAVQKGMAVGKELMRSGAMTEDVKKVLFGQTANTVTGGEKEQK